MKHCSLIYCKKQNTLNLLKMCLKQILKVSTWGRNNGGHNSFLPWYRGDTSSRLSLPSKSQMFLSNKQRETERADVRSGDLPWGGKHFPAPSSPFRWLGSTGRRRCTPRCARTVCKHQKIKTQIAQSVQPPKSKTSGFLSLLLPLSSHLFLPLTWCSHSDTESCPLCCSRWCQCPPAGLGSKSTWGSECASSVPWRRAGSGRRSSPHILHTTWGPAVHLMLGCSPCCPRRLLDTQKRGLTTETDVTPTYSFLR